MFARRVRAFEDLKVAARRLREEVRPGQQQQGGGKLYRESVGYEKDLERAAKAVAARKGEVERQLAAEVRAVEAARDRLLQAVSARSQALVEALREAANGKLGGLEAQRADMVGGAGALRAARESTAASLRELDVEQRPAEVVSACLRLRRQVQAVTRACDELEPACQADLRTELQGFDAIAQQVGRCGWAGATAKPTGWVVTVLEPADGRVVQPGAAVKLRLRVFGKDGRPTRASLEDVAVREQPSGGRRGEGETQGAKRRAGGLVLEPDSISIVSKEEGRAVDISCRAKSQGVEEAAELWLRVQVSGEDVQGSPVLLPVSGLPSLILQPPQLVITLRGFLPTHCRLRLCYRASRDGWSAADFHRCCDGQGSTVVVLQEAEHGYVFGGYTSVPWASPPEEGDGQHAADPSAFLFSLTNPSSHPPVKLPCTDPARAVYHQAGSCAIFGNMSDLNVVSHANTQACWSSLPRTFRAQPWLVGAFLAGSHSFKLREFEVFTVTYK